MSKTVTEHTPEYIAARAKYNRGKRQAESELGEHIRNARAAYLEATAEAQAEHDKAYAPIAQKLERVTKPAADIRDQAIEDAKRVFSERIATARIDSDIDAHTPNGATPTDSE